MTEDPEYIVAEVSKNWPDRSPPKAGEQLIAQLFETVINRNERIGYALHSFQLNRCFIPDGGINETIVAVFRKKGPDDR